MSAHSRTSGSPMRSDAATNRGDLRRPFQSRTVLPLDRVVHRDRLAAAAVAVVATRGYNETTISEITATAGVSRPTFDQHFQGKPACFLAAYDLIAADLRDSARAATDADQEWTHRVRASLAVALAAFAANPDLVRFCLIAPTRALEPTVAARPGRFLSAAAAELCAGAPAERRGSALFEAAILSGLASLVVAKVEAGEAHRLADLGVELSELVLLHFIGPDQARHLARAPIEPLLSEPGGPVASAHRLGTRSPRGAS